MWLKQTYKGVASGIVYAKKGDKVNVIRVEDQLSFVEFNGEKFHVRNELLSDGHIEPEKQLSEPVITKPQPESNKKKVSKAIKQTQLF